MVTTTLWTMYPYCRKLKMSNSSYPVNKQFDIVGKIKRLMQFSDLQDRLVQKLVEAITLTGFLFDRIYVSNGQLHLSKTQCHLIKLYTFDG